MLRSKFVGCLVGTAVGDALGRSFEGSWSPEVTLENLSGRWTDDTAMMIGVAESLIEKEGFDGRHMAETFIKNYESEPWRGLRTWPTKGVQMDKVWRAVERAAKRLYRGAGSYGNGAAMRVAPVGVFYHDNPEQLHAVACGQSLITHTHQLGMEGAALQAYAVALAINAYPSSRRESAGFLDKLKAFTHNEVYKQKLEKVEELLSETNIWRAARELGNGVKAHNSVPTAIYSFLCNPHSFEEAVRYAISLGGDTDTIGAMTGAISGAYHGAEAIPEGWKSKLEAQDHIETLGEKLWKIKIKNDSFVGSCS